MYILTKDKEVLSVLSRVEGHVIVLKDNVPKTLVYTEILMMSPSEMFLLGVRDLFGSENPEKLIVNFKD